MASAPKISETRLMYGVPGKNWRIAPASTPMIAPSRSLGRIRRIARQYMAMTKFGFMTVK